MSDPLSEAELKLKRLGERVRQGRALQHPLTDKERAAVRTVVQAQWAEQQKQGKTPAPEPPASPSAKSEDKSLDKSPSHDPGPSH